MTGGDAGPLRLAAVAALVGLDLAASRDADAWIGLHGEPCSENEAELIISATGAERQLTEALPARRAGRYPNPTRRQWPGCCAWRPVRRRRRRSRPACSRSS